MNEDGTMTIRELQQSNPTPAESIAYGQNLFKKWTSNINWKNIAIWITMIAILGMVFYVIGNINFLKQNPLAYCKTVTGCFCGS